MSKLFVGRFVKVPVDSTPTDISYAAIEKGANPKQVYSDYIRQFDDDKDLWCITLKHSQIFWKSTRMCKLTGLCVEEEGMSFYEDQEDDWFANDCKGVPSDYYAGDLAPWQDNFTDTSAQPKVRTEAQESSQAPQQSTQTR